MWRDKSWGKEGNMKMIRDMGGEKSWGRRRRRGSIRFFFMYMGFFDYCCVFYLWRELLFVLYKILRLELFSVFCFFYKI